MTKNLNEALLCFQGRNVSVMKNARAAINDRAGYKYADLPQVLEAVIPALTECGLLLKQRIVLDRETKMSLLETSVVHVASGEAESMDLPCFIDEKPQSFGSRLTYMRRYSVLAILNLAPDDDDDGRTAQQEMASRDQARDYRERNQREYEQRRSAPSAPAPRQPPRQPELPPPNQQRPAPANALPPPAQERQTRDHQTYDLGDCPECGERLMRSKYPDRATGKVGLPYCKACKVSYDPDQHQEQYHGSY